MCWWPVVILALAACTSSPAPPPTFPPEAPPMLLQIGLASSASALATILAEDYAQEAPHVQLQIVVANSATLHADLAAGLLDAVLVHHIPEGNGRFFNPVALDGLTILVHPDNPVEELTAVEVQAIFSGQITNWQMLGGPDMEIVLLNREAGSGVRSILRQRLMAERRFSPNALLQTGSEAMLTAVAQNPSAIGYGSMSSASQAAGVKMVQVDGRSATPVTTAAQNYPLTMPLYFLTSGEQEPIGELRAFLAWLQSEPAQAKIGGTFGRVR